FQDFPTFMKKVISVEQPSEEKLNWKAKIFWSSRTWESTIIEQLPDKRIVWRSKGPKGHVDGAVTFHRVAPNLTRVLLVLEYHPQGLFERTGNLWRAQGRRARLELKNFRRHVMSQSLLKADEIEGWRGEIRDSKVVMTHEEGLAAEEKAQKEGSDQYEESYDREPAKASSSSSSKTTSKKSEKEPQASR
ncbi:SRPBCC family protein, partial [Actinomadura rudentiformis]